MAVTQSSVTANIGNGVEVEVAMHGTAREKPVVLKMVQRYKRKIGRAAATAVRLGVAIAAASFAEAASAVTPTTLPTPTQVAITPAGYQASMGLTDEARLRATESN